MGDLANIINELGKIKPENHQWTNDSCARSEVPPDNTSANYFAIVVQFLCVIGGTAYILPIFTIWQAQAFVVLLAIALLMVLTNFNKKYYQWIEINGTTIQGKSFVFRKIIQSDIENIRLVKLDVNFMDPLSTSQSNYYSGARIKFMDNTDDIYLSFLHPKMTKPYTFLSLLLTRMEEHENLFTHKKMHISDRELPVMIYRK